MLGVPLEEEKIGRLRLAAAVEQRKKSASQQKDESDKSGGANKDNPESITHCITPTEQSVFRCWSDLQRGIWLGTEKASWLYGHFLCGTAKNRLPPGLDLPVNAIEKIVHFLPQYQWKLVSGVVSWTEKPASVLSNDYHIWNTFQSSHFRLVSSQERCCLCNTSTGLWSTS